MMPWVKCDACLVINYVCLGSATAPPAVVTDPFFLGKQDKTMWALNVPIKNGCRYLELQSRGFFSIWGCCLLRIWLKTKATHGQNERTACNKQQSPMNVYTFKLKPESADSLLPINTHYCLTECLAISLTTVISTH